MIRDKLTVLLDSGIVDQETYDHVFNVLSYLLEKEIVEEEQRLKVIRIIFILENCGKTYKK